MGKLQLTLACTLSEHVSPLFTGRVKPDGIDLITVHLNHPSEIFWRMLRFQEFDASEMSLASYLRVKLAGQPFIAIPVFPSRKFRHSFVFVHKDAGIENPEDLAGKRVGVPEYQMTAAVWVRGFLQHDYGLEPHHVKWFLEREERTPFSGYPGLSLERIPPGKKLDAMLINQEIDGLINPRPSHELLQSDQVRRLFPDFKKVEMDYFKRTGVFPIMHTVVLRQEIYDRHPWVANCLMDAFTQAKKIYLEDRDIQAMNSPIVWIESHLLEEAVLFGKDPLPYGLRQNRKTIETLIEYSLEQGLINVGPSMEELFAPNTIES
jgi:4,5-dihydroxyphthalate decarboxylase